MRRVAEGQQGVNVTGVVVPEVRAALKARARAEDRSISAVVRDILTEWWREEQRGERLVEAVKEAAREGQG